MRLAALLMPEAAPERSSSTMFMIVVVSGEIAVAMPRPSSATGSRKVAA